MSQSLPNRLPGILARAAVRSSEALYALGVRPGQRKTPWSSPHAVDNSAWPMASELHTRLQTGHDLDLLLDNVIGGPRSPSLRGRVGVLWLRAEPSQPRVAAFEAPARTPCADDLALSQAWLSDLAVRLFVARELLAPSALVALTTPTDLGTCIPQMLKTLLGSDPQRLALNTPDGPTILVCRMGATTGSRRALVHRQHTLSLPQCLRDTPAAGRTAMVMRPDACILDLQPAWSGTWLLTDPEPAAIGALCGQLGHRTRDEHRGRSTPWSSGMTDTAMEWRPNRLLPGRNRSGGQRA